MSLVYNTHDIQSFNNEVSQTHSRDFAYVKAKLEANNLYIDEIFKKLDEFDLEIPSWGLSIGGTRFARFAEKYEPKNIQEKLEDYAVLKSISGFTKKISLHFPWDFCDDYTKLKSFADENDFGFGAINSNSFQDQKNQKLSYKYGSLTNADPEIRTQAINHNIDCIKIGEILGANMLSVWIGDGSNFPGQIDYNQTLNRYIESMKEIYAVLPKGWNLLLEHKFYEPAFYSTVINDWGTSLMCANLIGEKALCLLDLGHHAPNTNIEQIASRLGSAKKLGGVHFNDSKYGDDDLDAGSINPYQLFLLFHQFREIEIFWPEFNPTMLIDQSHNITDPMESLIASIDAIIASYIKSLLIDTDLLHEHQNKNDVIMARRILENAYETDVKPIIAEYRLSKNKPIDPIAFLRKIDYRAKHCASR